MDRTQQKNACIFAMDAISLWQSASKAGRVPISLQASAPHLEVLKATGLGGVFGEGNASLDASKISRYRLADRSRQHPFILLHSRDGSFAYLWCADDLVKIEMCQMF